MLVLLSPAKSLDWTPIARWIDPSTPELAEETKTLAQIMRGMSAEEIRALTKISPKLSKLTYERFQSMQHEPDRRRDRPAALAFDGAVYRALQARTLEARELKWSQQHVVILSGLYGALRPLDLIEPHRLEMGTKLKTARGGTLHEYWGQSVTKVLADRLESTGSEVVVNLTSQQYGRVVDFRRLGVPVVTPIFQEVTEKQHRVVGFLSKCARGMMARYIIDKRMSDIERIKRFKGGGYKFDKSLSSDQSWVFTRPKVEPVED